MQVTPAPTGPRSRWIAVLTLVVLAAVFMIWVVRNNDVETDAVSLDEESPSGRGAPAAIVAPEAEDVDVFIGLSDPSGLKEAEDVLKDNGESLLGQLVKVEGEIKEIVGANAVLIDTDGAIGQDEILVVYSKENISKPDVEVGDKAAVAGRVVKMNRVALKDKMEGGFAANRIHPHEDQPMIDATIVAH